MRLIAMAGCCLMLFPGAACAQSGPAAQTSSLAEHTSARHAEVAGRGAHVMPFDLDRSSHVFERRADGGVQTVVSDDGAPDQVQAIRTHLRHEAAAFARGDFASPAAIHGSDMPGLRELAASAKRLSVVYEDAPGGGRIRYASADPVVVTALHRWFAAQVSDHGAHASNGSNH